MREPHRPVWATRPVWASGLAAALVVGVAVAWLQYADRAAGLRSTWPAVHINDDRVGPQIEQITTWGTWLGALYVAVVCLLAGKGGPWWVRLRGAAVAAAVTAGLYTAYGLWLVRENEYGKVDVAEKAFRWAIACVGPSAGLITAAAVAAAMGRGGARISFRGRVALTAAGATGVLFFAAVRTFQTLNDAHDTLDKVYWIAVTTGVPLTALLTGFLVHVMVARALRPVEAIRRELADITGQSLDRRVPVPPTGDVIADLARTTNATLDRVEAAATRQREFTADAAHELRSPLAALRAQLESALRHPDSVENWQEVVREATEDVIRLQHLTDDLLLLAGQGSAAPVREPVDLSALAEDLVREHQHLPEAKTLRVRCEAPAPAVMPGNPTHLDRLLRNLLTNACRHARTEVTVTVAQAPTHTTLTVQDDGPGIPPADRTRVFDRFTRLDTARTRTTGGAGLGLPIARDLATAHGGTLTIGDSEEGALLVARFPAGG
ncbi:HAMP domain-containing sensor histidine kinase [Streptomyces sp. CC208A]|uniref:sensor histidine kinase n=1 Tax=Streptomyces sp. CC208A TaxID=3044573 RepID=UPI0024A9CF97|nr:HAMP domain-containing sensor histidine kinase [Streptomyces sp. CC208A]